MNEAGQGSGLQNVSRFLPAKREHAASMLAGDYQPDRVIAAEVGVTMMTLNRWKRDPEFQAAIARHREEQRAAVASEGIANKQNRVRALNDRWQRMQRVIDARAVTKPPKVIHSQESAGREEPDTIDAPGWDTGLMVEVVKKIGQVTEFRYEVDTGLLKEIRAHEEQAAKELGQWVEKTEQDQRVTIRRYIGVDVDAV